MSIEGENDEIQITGNVDSQDDDIAIKCDRKCLHQGDRICFNDEPKKQTIKKIPDETTATESVESYGSLHSGESLFKTFSFDVDDQDPDIEKCVAFWQKILGKNIKPIKCTTVVKNKKEKSREKPTIKETPKRNCCDDPESRKFWLSIYKDLQRRNLDKQRLLHNKKCDPCEYIDEEEEKKQQVKDIVDLNTWQTQSHPSKIDIKEQVQRTLHALKEKKSPSSSKTSSVTATGKSKTSRTRSDFSSKEKNSASMSTPLPTPEKRRSVSQKSLNHCCVCGCDIPECICPDLEQIMTRDEAKSPKNQGTDRKDENKFGPCYPCDCTVECVCPDISLKETENKLCVCGCLLEECCCEKLDAGQKPHEPCPCECGMEECICEQLFEKSCKCGHADCDCGLIEILNAYLDSLNGPSSKVRVSMKNEDLQVVSKQSQTEDEKKWLLETTQKQGSYCVICGHFNCYCKTENPPE